MRKGFLVMLAVVLVAVLAAPAMAGTDINGFYRAKAYLTNFSGYLGSNNFLTGGQYTGIQTPAKDTPSRAYVDQRMRLKVSSGDENVKAVGFFEFDSVWGDVNNGRNTGGGLGGDSSNLETKNAYLWFKLPNTPVDVTVGLQGQSDSYAGVFMFATDMSGIFVNAKLAPMALRLGWAKWTEKDLSKADDRTFYLAEAKFAPTKDVKVGANLYVLQDDQNRPAATSSIQRVYMPGVDVTFGAGPASINAFAFYQFGKFTDYALASTSDVKIGGFAADVRADLNAGPGKAFAEVLYISGGDENGATAGQKYKSIVDAGYTNSLYTRTDMTILFNNIDVIGTVGGLYGSSMGNGGRGLMHAAGGFTMKMGDKMNGKVGAGFLQATKLLKTETTSAPWKKKNMGTEVNASLNYNLMKGLDVGVVGAYAFIGDFFKTSSTSSGDPDNAYDLHARINYAF